MSQNYSFSTMSRKGPSVVSCLVQDPCLFAETCSRRPTCLEIGVTSDLCLVTILDFSGLISANCKPLETHQRETLIHQILQSATETSGCAKEQGTFHVAVAAGSILTDRGDEGCVSGNKTYFTTINLLTP